MDASDRGETPTRVAGRRAEEIAARYLVSQGASILARNVRVGRGEVDLVIAVGGERAVVEVRSVTTPPSPMPDRLPAHPLDAFDARKAAQVRRLARALRCSRVDLVVIRLHAQGIDLHWVKRAG